MVAAEACAGSSTTDGLLSRPREERESQHCLELAQSLHDAYVMKDVYLKCSDDICVPVHKFVLGSQSDYFKQQFFAKRGIDNISANSVVNRMYAFHGSSPCFAALVAFFYTAQIPELEEAGAALHPLPQHLSDLLAMALLYPSVGPPALALYIIGRLAAAAPPPPRQAVAWVEFVQAQEAKDGSIANAPKQALRNMAYKALAKQPFASDCFVGTPDSESEPATPASAGAVAEVLDNVPLQVSEVEVCEAVRQWSAIAYGTLGRASSGGGFAAGDSGDDLQTGDIATHEGLQLVKSKLDLSFVSNEDIFNRVKPMNLFTRRELIEVAKDRVNKGNVETGVNSNRGASLLAQLQL